MSREPANMKKNVTPELRITIGPRGIIRVEGDSANRDGAMELVGKLMPAITEFDREIRRIR